MCEKIEKERKERGENVIIGVASGDCPINNANKCTVNENLYFRRVRRDFFIIS
jgi:hypothetical protein